MPFTCSLQSAIDRGLRRTGLGQDQPFDINSQIADNRRWTLRNNDI
jgi:hypothetical protein